MSRNYKFSDQRKLYFVTYGTILWIDALTRPHYKNIIVESLQYCIDNKGMEIYAWCIMSNHVHLIIGSTITPLQDIMRDHKRFTSRKCIKAIEENPSESRKEWMLPLFREAGKENPNNEKYQFWQQHNHPIELTSKFLMDQKLEYIHMNPVVAGIVEAPEHYIYSSAKDYQGRKGLLSIKFIE